MIGVYTLLGGILLFVSVIGMLDWLAERQQRRERASKPSER